MTSLPELPALARWSTERAAHRRRDQRWLDQAWPSAQVLIIEWSGRAVVRACSGGVELALVGADSAPDDAERIFLGVHAQQPFFAAVVDRLADVDGAVHLYDVGEQLSDRDVDLFTSATALVKWHRKHLFAVRNGKPTMAAEAGWLRVTDDGEMEFPRTDPAVIVLVHDDVPGPPGRCLLGSNARATDVPPRFSLLAGFVEPGESAEAALVREVAEEVGVHVTDLRYVHSESWPYPGSLMLGFTAVADPGQPIIVDPVELKEARWFTRREIRAALDDPGNAPVTLPRPSSIANFILSHWAWRS